VATGSWETSKRCRRLKTAGAVAQAPAELTHQWIGIKQCHINCQNRRVKIQRNCSKKLYREPWPNYQKNRNNAKISFKRHKNEEASSNTLDVPKSSCFRFKFHLCSVLDGKVALFSATASQTGVIYHDGSASNMHSAYKCRLWHNTRRTDRYDVRSGSDHWQLNAHQRCPDN